MADDPVALQLVDPFKIFLGVVPRLEDQEIAVSPVLGCLKDKPPRRVHDLLENAPGL